MTGANDVWVVRGERFGEVLVPDIEDVVLEVDEDGAGPRACGCSRACCPTTPRRRDARAHRHRQRAAGGLRGAALRVHDRHRARARPAGARRPRPARLGAPRRASPGGRRAVRRRSGHGHAAGAALRARSATSPPWTRSRRSWCSRTRPGSASTQTLVEELGASARLLVLCGRYEGVDERVRALVDRSVSIGDYVLTGGELPAMVLVDAVSRLIPGVLGRRDLRRGGVLLVGAARVPAVHAPAGVRRAWRSPRSCAAAITARSRAGVAHGPSSARRGFGRTCSTRADLSEDERALARDVLGREPHGSELKPTVQQRSLLRTAARVGPASSWRRSSSLGIITMFVVQPFAVPTGSMIPAVQPGDRVIVAKYAYELGEPQRGDVVVFSNWAAGPARPAQAHHRAARRDHLHGRAGAVHRRRQGALNEPYLEEAARQDDRRHGEVPGHARRGPVLGDGGQPQQQRRLPLQRAGHAPADGGKGPVRVLASGRRAERSSRCPRTVYRALPAPLYCLFAPRGGPPPAPAHGFTTITRELRPSWIASPPSSERSCVTTCRSSASATPSR